MGKTHERISDRLRAFITAQPIFFTATAPLSGSGTVNLSPKGLAGSLAVTCTPSGSPGRTTRG